MESNQRDFSTGLGILLAFAVLLYAIATESTLAAYLDLPAFLIVIVGTLAITTACFTLSETVNAVGLAGRTLFDSASPAKNAARGVLELAEQSRKNGILALQNTVKDTRTPAFLRKALALVVDGLEVETVETILRQDIGASVERDARSASILRKAAETAPAMGLIGTLIGLVQMLGSLEDPSKIGPAMAVALLATLYGALMSYVVFSPLASKLERNSKNETLIHMLYSKGVLSIARKENPRRTEILLNTILPPGERIRYFA